MPRLRFRLAALGIVIAIFPFFLRRRPRVERRTTICAAPDVIFPLINDLRAWPLWTPWAEREEIDFFYGDIVEGIGAVQRWRTAKSDGFIRITRSEASRRVDYELVRDGGAHRMFGRLELVEDGACTRVTWKCVWEPARNPYRRYLDLYLRWIIARDFTAGLSSLKGRVERLHAPVPPSA